MSTSFSREAPSACRLSPSPGSLSRPAQTRLECVHESQFANGWEQPHDTGRFHPRNLLQLLLALIQRHEKDVSPDVTAHYFHHLRAADVLSAINFDVIARFHSKAPGAFAVVIEGSDRHTGEKNNPDSKSRP